MKKLLIGASILTTILSFAPSAQAFQVVRSFTSFLDASQEVTLSTSTATGVATLDLLGEDIDDDNIFDVFQLQYQITVTPPLDFTDISTLPGVPFTGDENVSMIHLHAGAPRGVNGVLPFNIRSISPIDGSVIPSLGDDDLMINTDVDGITTISGLLEADEFAPVDGFPDFQSIVDELLATPSGQDTSLYWNIHTEGFPGGAIRGQVEATPEPSSLLALGIIGGSLGLFSFSKGCNKR